MDVLGFDSETNKNFDKPHSCRSVQFFDPKKNFCYVAHRTDEMCKSSHEWDVSYVHRDDSVERTGRRITTEKIIQILTNKERGLITHSGTFDALVSLRDFGVEPNIVGDTYILGCLIPWGPQYSRSLDAMCKKLVNPDYDKAKYGSWDEFDWDRPLPDEALLYAGRDAIGVYDLHEEMLKTYKKYAGFSYKLEVDLIPVFSRMKLEGLPFDRQEFLESLEFVKGEYEEKYAALLEERGKDFNPSSKEEIRKWLFDELGLTPIRRTKTGKGSVDKTTLERFDTPATKKILEFNSAQYLKSSLESIEENAEYELIDDGKVMLFHPEAKSVDVSQDSTRIYYKPSITQWPWKVRQAVRNPEGLCYYCDVSQFEIMITAFASGEESLIESYLSGGDIHAEVAQSLETSRETAKEAEFSILFGSEGYAIANSMGIPIERARKYVEDFLGKYPRIKALRDRVYSLADEYSQAFTAFGRVRKLGYAKHEGEIKERRRQAWNYFAQSSAGEIIKKVILDIKRANIPGVSIKATVFDSILVFVPSEEAAREIDAVVKRSLKFSCRGRVWEFRFESGVGKTWLEAKENAVMCV